MTIIYLPFQDWMLAIIFFMIGVWAFLSMMVNLLDFSIILKIKRNGKCNFGKYTYYRTPKIEEQKNETK